MNRVSAVAIIGTLLCIVGGIFIISNHEGVRLDLLGHSMGMNVAICIALCGITFLTTHFYPERQKAIYISAGSLIALIAGLTLSQDIFNYSLGIDQLLSTPINSDFNPHPGRMAANTATALIMLGLAFCILPFSLQKVLSIVVQVLIFGVTFLGVTAVVGYVFKIDFLYGWYQYPSMSMYTALCLSIAGYGLWEIWKQSDSYIVYYRHREDRKILLLSCVILFAIASTAGLLGFIVSAQQNEATIEKFFEEILVNKTTIFEEAIDRATREVSVIQSNTRLQNIVANKANLNTQDNFAPFTTLLLNTTFSGFEIRDLKGKSIFKLGSFTQNPTVSIPLKLPNKANLIWRDNHLILSMGGNIEKDGVAVATFTAEWLIESVNNLFMNSENDADLLLCGMSASRNAVCLDPRVSQNTQIVFHNPTSQKMLERDIVNRRMAVIKGVNAKKENILALYGPIGTQALGLMIKTNSGAIYRPLRKQLEIVLPILLLSIFIGAILLYWRVLPLIHKVVASKKKAFASNVKLRAIMDHVADAIVTFDESGAIESFNPRMAEIFGYPAFKIVGKNINMFIPNCKYRDANKSENEYIESTGLHYAGNYFPVEYAVTKMKMENYHIYVVIIRDVSERKAAEEKLLESENRFRTAFDSAASGVIIVSLDGHFEQVNHAFCQMLGYSEKELLGRDFQSVTHPDDLEKSKQLYDQLLTETTRKFQIEKRYIDKKGQIIWVLVSASLVRSATGKPINLIAQVQNITKLKLAEEQLTYQAYYDSLTGLANRSQLESNLNTVIASAERSQKGFAVFFLDLDKFKNVNDTLGHDAGDMLLRAVAQRLKACTRASDIVARIGGDEFVLVLMELDVVQNAAIFAEKLINSLIKPIKIKEHELFVTTSIGISFYPVDGVDSQTLIKNADLALYRAKEKGRNNYQFCTPESSAKIQQKMAFESALRHALDANEFELFYQSKIDMRTNHIVSVEALLRWHSAEYGMVAPTQIISMTEESGLSIPLGDWVMKAAIAQTRKWQMMGLPHLNVAVNVSPRQFKNPLLVTSLSQHINESDINPKHVTLEITESLIMQDPEHSIEIIRGLKAVGVQIVIDNFGTGYSSLSYLQRFGVDQIKIDRSFVRDLPHDVARVALVSAIIALAKSLGVRVVAEGVETQEQFEFLNKQGCDEAQGFYISRPVSVDDETILLGAQLTETSD